MEVLSDGDLSGVRSNILDMIADKPEDIVIRRGKETLTPQTVRVELIGNQVEKKDSSQSREHRVKCVVVGDIDLDINIDDLFNNSRGQLCRVSFVDPNRQVCTQAEAEIIE